MEAECFFTKSDQMSRVGSRDRHTGWRSKMTYIIVVDVVLEEFSVCQRNHMLKKMLSA